MKEYDNVHILDHPLIRHKVAIIRDKNTTTKQFREVIGEIATLTYSLSEDSAFSIVFSSSRR